MANPASKIDQADRPSQEPGCIELPSISSVPAVASPSATPMPAMVRGAYQVGRNIYHYPQPGILADQTNAAVMTDVRTTFKVAQAEASTWGFRLSQRVFRKLLVEEASISVPSIDVERGFSTTRIVLHQPVLRPELTTLFNGLDVIGGNDNFAQHFPDVVTSSTVVHVLVVTSALKKAVVGWTCFLLSIVCLAICVSVAFATKDWFKGAGVAGALWTLGNLLLGAFVYMGKR